MLFEGVSWDKESAERERETLFERRAVLKSELDRLAGTPLYPTTRRRSELLRDLYARQRDLLAARKRAGARSEAGRALGADLTDLRSRIRDVRNSDAAWDFEIGDGLSGPRLAAFLYGKEAGQLGFPAHKKRRKETGRVTVTVDDVALQKLAQRYGDRPLPTGRGVLLDLIRLLREHRRVEKLISTYLNPEKLLSPTDGRFHAQYKPYGTQTGRLSSSSDPWGYGGNAQNIDREYKWLFLPDLEDSHPRPDSCRREEDREAVASIREAVWVPSSPRMAGFLACGCSDHSKGKKPVF